MKDFLSDLEIASAASKKHITDIGDSLGIPEENLILYGNDKAKINYDYFGREYSG